ncbi:uncharacterized protein BDZ99DRAFT_469386 [Mytilinidion resinicola]|uniref:Mid2 domain-containing protein n=1 Tax=Mytilinidion resinicola TaxID=574789 RepID=A0A6A6Y250_9PEZI|nr:uncharacterized protein BDZ99DRAFT_469386 [Mytilinidion resinicola]KAF2801887.1 hypothetical protein BDZ99DRAFT_469386 [Mytilinidion resinicola]
MHLDPKKDVWNATFSASQQTRERSQWVLAFAFENTMDPNIVVYTSVTTPDETPPPQTIPSSNAISTTFTAAFSPSLRSSATAIWSAGPASFTTSSSQTPSSGLTIVAKLVIGISIPLAVVAIAFGIVIFFHRRQEKGKLNPEKGPAETTSQYFADNPSPLVAELHDHSTVPIWHELPGHPSAEAENYRSKSASSSVHELRQAEAAQEFDARELQRQASLAASVHAPHELSASRSRQATPAPPVSAVSTIEPQGPLVPPIPQSSIPHNSTPTTTGAQTEYPQRPTSPIDDNASVHVSRHASTIAGRTTNDDAELAQIEEAMARLRNQKKLLQELRDVERQEAEMERRRKELRRARGGSGGSGD